MRSHARRRIGIGGDIVTEARMGRIDITDEDGLIHDREVRVEGMIRERIGTDDGGMIAGRDIHDDDAIRMREIDVRDVLVAAGVRDAPTAETGAKIEMETDEAEISMMATDPTAILATDKMETSAKDATATTATETATTTDGTETIATKETFAITETVEITEEATPPTAHATTQKTKQPKKKSASAN